MRIIEDHVHFTGIDKSISNCQIRKFILPGFDHVKFVEEVMKPVIVEFYIHLDCIFVNQIDERNEDGMLENNLSYVWPSINTACYSKRIISPRSFETVTKELTELSLDDILMKAFTVHDSISFYSQSKLRPRDLISLVIYIQKTGQPRF